MKKKTRKSDKVTKGAPSGFVISLIFHAAAFFVAGLFVVFTVLPKEEPEFKAPPPVERPKMKLKKPKVKIKKSSQPKPSSRIVAKVKTAKMPEIQIPDLVGTGDGLLGGLGMGGEFMDLPELPDTTAFGSAETTGNDLVGTFYDFKRRRDGGVQPIDASPGTTPNAVDIIVHKFMERDWSTSAFSEYYHSPKKLYASTICIGTVQSTLAPEAFGETDTDGFAWAVLYEGKLVYPEDIRFRFRGVGDKFMGVRVDGKVVLLCIYNDSVRDYFSDIWNSTSSESRIYPMGEGMQQVGDWIELKAGKAVDMQVLLGDRHGGLVYHQLVVEVEGVDYPQNSFRNGPTLPVFKTDILTHQHVDALMVDVYPGDVCLTNGPVFCDYVPQMVSLNQPLPTNPPPPFAKEFAKKIRTWTSTSGTTLEGKFLANMGDYILLEKADQSQQKIPYAQLSEEDKQFISLANPPKFKLEFSKRSDQVPIKNLGPYDNGRPLAIFDYTFGARVKQDSSGDYGHELKIEYFAIGGEHNGNNYILLERRSDTFIPSKANKFSHEFYGKPIRMRQYANRFSSPERGTKYKGNNLVVLTDEKGRVVDYRASNEFLFENLEKLRALQVGSYFNKNCDRVYPTRPTDDDRGPGAFK